MYIKREVVIPVVVGVVSFAAGAVSGYFFRKAKREHDEVKRFREDLDEVASDTLQLKIDWNDHQRLINKNLQESNKVLRKFHEVNLEAMGQPIPQPSPPGEPVPHSLPIFIKDEELAESKKDHPSKRSEWREIAQVVDPMVIVVTTDENGREIDPNWSYEEELEHRRPGGVYIIHRDEFFSNEMDFEQTTITYYQKDNVLCDESDIPIPNYERVVGRLQFGHGSLDQSICYVRSEKIEHEWEVLLDEGSFAVEVLGADTENDIRSGDLKHSVPKFRRE